MSKDRPHFELDIRVSIRDLNAGGGYLNIDENIRIDSVDFLEMAAILGEFHKLAQKFNAEKGEE